EGADFRAAVAQHAERRAGHVMLAHLRGHEIRQGVEDRMGRRVGLRRRGQAQHGGAHDRRRETEEWLTHGRARLYARAGHTYSATGGQEHIRFRSPYGLSMRPTDGQCLFARTNGSGNAASSREYGWLQSSAAIAPAVCGAFLSTLSRRSALPSITAWISARIEIMASQKRSSSSCASLSVGSTIIVPATGNETVGAW